MKKIFILKLLLFAIGVHASSYRPTPLSKSIANHDLIVVANVISSQNGKSTVKIVKIIKGKSKTNTLVLSSVWRPNTEFLYGPIPLKLSKTYLLMLKKQKGQYKLSSDFASRAVHQIRLKKDRFTDVIQILAKIEKKRNKIDREKIFALAYEKLDVMGQRMLIEDFMAIKKPDPSTIPFLIRSLEQGHNAGIASRAIVQYNYTNAISDLLRCLQKPLSSLSCAYALADLKVHKAYQPIMKLIQDESIGNRPYFIEALVKLQDKRSIPYLLKTLHRNIENLDPNYGSYRSWSIQENEFAAWGLGKLQTPKAVEPLIEVLNTPYKKLRNKAVVALGEIGPAAKKAIPILHNLITIKHAYSSYGSAEILFNDLVKKAILSINR